MDNLLKHQFVDVVNSIRIGTAPMWNTVPNVRHEDIADYQFDIIDSKEDSISIKRGYNQGTATYINGEADETYNLRFISFDDFLHQFVYDDGIGHIQKSMFCQHMRMADFLVYSQDENKYFIVHELCKGRASNKRNRARIQLSSTINMLYKSVDVKNFINLFENKICYLTANEEKVSSPNNIADGFMLPYDIVPDPVQFTFGQIGTFGFKAYEACVIKLEK